MLNIGIAGASGYTGVQLCKLLLDHPQCQIVSVYAHKNVGKTVAEVCPYLYALSDLKFEALDANSLGHLDVLFMALPHATSHELLPAVALANPNLKIIDLSADFRLDEAKSFQTYYDCAHAAPDWLSKLVYALPELNRDAIVGAQYAAVPGCYATTCILGLNPLADKNLLEGRIIIDAKSGVSGAGKTLSESFLFCEVNESFQAYKTGAHRHQAEFEMVFPGKSILFSPHLIPQSRGILASIYVDNVQDLTQVQVMDLYTAFYENSPFIRVTEDATPSTRSVVGSNCCVISPKVIDNGRSIVIFACTDNLVKGAAGQAVQVLNLMLGFEESLSLPNSPRMI